MKKNLLPIILFAIICILGNSMILENRTAFHSSSLKTGSSLVSMTQLNWDTENDTIDTLTSLLYNPQKWPGSLQINGKPLNSGLERCRLIPETTFAITGINSGRVTSKLILTWTGSEFDMNKSTGWVDSADVYKYVDPTDSSKVLLLQVDSKDTIMSIGILIVGTTFPVIIKE